MNAFSPLTAEQAVSEALRPVTISAQNAKAFFSLALTQKRLSWRYRKWALEAADAGNLDAYRRDRDEAKKLWRGAKESLSWARHHHEMDLMRSRHGH